MATLEQQEAAEFREQLQRAWDRRYNEKKSISKTVESQYKQVKDYLEAVRKAAAEITKDDVSIKYEDPEFDADNVSLSQRFTFSSWTYDYRIDLTFYENDVFYKGKGYSIQSMRHLFQALTHDLLDAFKPQ